MNLFDVVMKRQLLSTLKLKMKNFVAVPKEEQLKFINSFDSVLSDMDGVIWVGYKPLPGVTECVNNLKKLGKSVSFVTNNSTTTTENMVKLLRNMKFSVNADDVINPVMAYISFLKEHNFKKTIFVLGGTDLKDELRKAGFKVAENPPYPIAENIAEITKYLVGDDEIGAVILDYDINLTFLQLQKALIYLKKSDCLCISGSSEEAIPFPQVGPLIGNYHFHQIIKELSGRKLHQMAKPSGDFSKFIKQKFAITNPKRVLFIGDSIAEDMRFATENEFQKLLVLTGISKKEHFDDWNYKEEYKPHYYVDSMAALNLILEKLQIK